MKKESDLPEITGVPLSKEDEILIESFWRDFTSQISRMDDLAKNLVTLGLALPGIFISFFTPKINTQTGTTFWPDKCLLWLAFVLWFLGLGFVLGALFPRKYEVDPQSLTQIKEYFYQVAKHKRNLLCFACVFWGASFFLLFSVLWRLY